MTRGKYAAKANGQRAEAAANTVVALRGQLDQERCEHAAAVSALRAEVSSLQGQLLREVRKLAAAEVHRVEQQGAERLQAERDAHHHLALEVCRRAAELMNALSDSGDRDDVPEFRSLYDFLVDFAGVPPRDLEAALAEVEPGKINRVGRRVSMRMHRHVVSGDPYVVNAWRG